MCTGLEIAMLVGAGTGLASEAGVFGKGAKEGKKVEYEAQAPKYPQDCAQRFFKYLQGQVGQGATPYGGQVAAPFVNPFTQGAFGAMKASPYGSMMGNLPMGGMPFVPPQQQRSAAPQNMPFVPPPQLPQQPLPPGMPMGLGGGPFKRMGRPLPR